MRIIEKLSPLSYRIELSLDSKIHDVISIIHLRHYHEKNLDIRPLSIEIEKILKYEMENINEERNIIDEGKEYLIKWKDYEKFE